MVRIGDILKNPFLCASYLSHRLYGLDSDIRQVYEDVYRKPINCCVAEGKHLTIGDYHSLYLMITHEIPVLSVCFTHGT
jgi:hypothetical protein